VLLDIIAEEDWIALQWVPKEKVALQVSIVLSSQVSLLPAPLERGLMVCLKPNFLIALTAQLESSARTLLVPLTVSPASKDSPVLPRALTVK